MNTLWLSLQITTKFELNHLIILIYNYFELNVPKNFELSETLNKPSSY